MKISKQLLLITALLFIFFASGCSKNLPEPDYAELDYAELDYPDPDSGYIKEKEEDYRIIKEKEEDSGFIKEENVGEVDTSSSPGDSGKEGNGLLSEGGDKDKTPDYVEPFLPEKGGGIVASLPQGEEVRRRLPYRSSAHLSDMFFAFDMYDLDEQLLAILQENVAYLKSHPFSKIEIQGHCDERGSNNYNLSLGQRRAQSIKSYLITLGVDESRIHTVSFGEEKPVCNESNEECWEQNRRALFLVVN